MRFSLPKEPVCHSTSPQQEGKEEGTEGERVEE